MLDNACQRFDRVGQWLDNGAGLVLCGAQKSPMKHQHSIMEVGTKDQQTHATCGSDYL